MYQKLFGGQHSRSSTTGTGRSSIFSPAPNGQSNNKWQIVDNDSETSSPLLNNIATPLSNVPDNSSGNINEPKTQVTISLLTYNVANNILHNKAITSLREAVFPANTAKANQPDLALFMLQESKDSALGSEQIPTRILKERTLDNGDTLPALPYTILDDINVRVLTHPEDPRNHLFNAKTELAIAYNNTIFKKNEIFTKHRGLCVTDGREHKGGVFFILSVHEVNIAVISVHLDSRDEAVAKQQLANLMEKCEIECAEKGICLDEMVIAGDFNIRLHPETFTSSSRNTRNRHSLINLKDLAGAIATTNDKWKEGFSTLQPLTLHAPEAISYCKGDTLKPNSERNGKYDLGALDMIAHKSYHKPESPLITIREPRTAKITTPGWVVSEKPASDHDPVIGQLTLSTDLPKNEKLRRKNNEALMRDHYQSAQFNEFRSYFTENELLTPTFLINHLDVFYGKSVNVPNLINIIFGTCEKIETTMGNTGDYMLKKYNQLLDAKTQCDARLKIMLLKPFREWLDAQKKERPHYYYCQYANDSYTLHNGFFSGRPLQDTQAVNAVRIKQL